MGLFVLNTEKDKTADSWVRTTVDNLIIYQEDYKHNHLIDIAIGCLNEAKRIKDEENGDV